MERAFTSNEVMVLTGISARQLQWWDEKKIVVPTRSGHRRMYSWDDVVTMAVICDLRERGFSLQRMRKVIRFLQHEFGRSLAQTVSGSSEYHLLTDGTDLYLETSPQQIVNILKNARQPMLAICLNDALRRVRAELRTGKKGNVSVARTTKVSRRAV
jgi:DNA-binding transcriptional MerR regulator